MWTPDPLGLPETPKKGARSSEQRLFKTTRSLSGGHSPVNTQREQGVRGNGQGQTGDQKRKRGDIVPAPKILLKRKSGGERDGCAVDRDLPWETENSLNSTNSK